MSLLKVNQWVHMPLQNPKTAKTFIKAEEVQKIEPDCGANDSTLLTMTDGSRMCVKGSVSEISGDIERAVS